MANKQCKQITLHFVGDDTEIIDIFKARAKKNYRTAEQEILFELSGLVEMLRDNDSAIPQVPQPVVPTEEEVNNIIGDAPDFLGEEEAAEAVSTEVK